jgi:hypothetical protein
MSRLYKVAIFSQPFRKKELVENFYRFIFGKFFHLQNKPKRVCFVHFEAWTVLKTWTVLPIAYCPYSKHSFPSAACHLATARSPTEICVPGLLRLRLSAAAINSLNK